MSKTILDIEAKRIGKKVEEYRQLTPRNRTELLEARMRFVAVYCKLRGWNVKSLTFEQIQEIQSQEEWKTGKNLMQ